MRLSRICAQKREMQIASTSVVNENEIHFRNICVSTIVCMICTNEIKQDVQIRWRLSALIGTQLVKSSHMIERSKW